MKTANNVPYTGLCKASGSHLEASNDQQPASELRRLLDNRWRYVSAAETDITRTFRRFGWVPGMRRAQ